MKTAELYEELRKAVALEGKVAALRVTATYEPIGGPGARVFPPTYPGSGDEKAIYLLETRRIDGQEREDVVLASVPAQASGAQCALLRALRDGRVSVPLMEIHHRGAAEATLTSFELPHRFADAYLRDSQLDGVDFDKSPLGRALLGVSAADVCALYAADPNSLVFGAWNSHRKGRSVKFPRIYSSEVIGWDPVKGVRHAGRMDPMNLTGAAVPSTSGDEWQFKSVQEKTKGERLSEIGHGNIAPNPQHGGMTISSAQRVATVSFAGLDRLGFGDASHVAAVAARTVLAAYAIVADRLAFSGPSLWLRSGCDLLLVDERIEWVLRGGSTQQVEISRSDALDLLAYAVAQATDAGLPWNIEPVVLTPKKPLAEAIDFALTKAESGGE